MGLAIFAILASSILGSYNVLSRSIKLARERTILATQAAHYLELVRNMPFSEIGTVNGNPSGNLADASNPINISIEGVSYDIYYEVTYLDDPADGTILAGTDVAPNDYKQVKLSVENNITGQVTKFLSNVSPKGLEGLNNAGALYITVFDANGQPIPNASVHIENTALNPDIILDRTTDGSGNLIEVALPVSINGYNITVTKNGYSSDQTYPITIENPNPIKPDSTIVDGQVTQISFAIDLVSDLTIRTLNTSCSAINGVAMNVRGSKLIGTSPNVLKFTQDYTSSSGQVSMSDIEWDNYIPVLSSSAPYTIYGTSPIQQVTVLPNSNQTFSFILGPETDHSIRVIVKDAATGTALEGATVYLAKTGSPTQDYYGTTGGSVWEQLDWSGGAGQIDYLNEDQFYYQDGFIDTSVSPTGIQLSQISGNYSANGTLESSTFDTGGLSNFTTLSWQPTSQNPQTELKFQLASNNDNATWNYIGPDGTSGTYYTTAGTNISSSHDNNRYIRYKASLTTNDPAYTPILTSVSVNYVSGCFTPGQVIFPDLESGSDYDLEVSLAGYSVYSSNSITINGNIVYEVLMSP